MRGGDSHRAAAALASAALPTRSVLWAVLTHLQRLHRLHQHLVKGDEGAPQQGLRGRGVHLGRGRGDAFIDLGGHGRVGTQAAQRVTHVFPRNTGLHHQESLALHLANWSGGSAHVHLCHVRHMDERHGGVGDGFLLAPQIVQHALMRCVQARLQERPHDEAGVDSGQGDAYLLAQFPRPPLRQGLTQAVPVGRLHHVIFIAPERVVNCDVLI
mmetsp:Transcript_45749/g.115146  ORF Transcript_45749/g.115146 Transcript_45749/m.115146 type:complete len:213 (+) Transcript_45749:177-815(+)